MTNFQADEGFNNSKFARKCKQEKKSCTLRLWPKSWQGNPDPNWFPVLLASDAPVLSKDFTIAYDEHNQRRIPNRAAGLIVVKPSVPMPAFSVKKAAVILDAFKEKFPRWSQVDWTDVYVEITDRDVSVQHIRGCSPLAGTRVAFEHQDFAGQLELAIIAARSKTRVISHSSFDASE